MPALAKMNQCFIEEEEPETHVSLPHLEERMSGYIASEYKAFFFMEDDKVVGYALCSNSKTPVYLRQFFIERGERRKGYGKQAFQLLLTHLNISPDNIDVYAWNDSGIRFWRSLGYSKSRLNMSYSV